MMAWAWRSVKRGPRGSASTSFAYSFASAGVMNAISASRASLGFFAARISAIT